MKVILSRKGFDSGAGGCPSPLLIDQGRFVSLPIPEVNKIYKSDSGTDRHIIWGYMQVGQIDIIDNEQEYELWKLGHPHYRNRDRNNNTGYISQECLSFAPELPGCGVFPFHSSLVLSNGNPNKRSEWSLPPFFAPASGTRMTYHENPERWQMDGDKCTLKSVSKGQEFVISGNPTVEEWAKGLFFPQSECSNGFVGEISQPIGCGSDDGYTKRSKSLVDRQRSVVRAAVPNNHPSTNDTLTVTMKCRRASSGEIFDVIFDIADLEKVRKYEWKVQKSHDSVYAVLQGTQNILLHRLICDDCLDKRVFAINKNYFDCRQSNLYAR